ncbi:MAG: hypothetical protein VR64_22100 [Desulfatitalea sp. BRH_c12]|nr:MAG: hypothetical protein VR64_22100 [Desulfatitalea sp. BRH_c12]
MNGRYTLCTIKASLVILLLALPNLLAAEIIIDDFSQGIRPGWREKSFAGHTEYTPAIEDGIHCLKATSSAAASALIYEIKFNVEAYPLLTWKWKIKNTIPSGDARRKEGDDYAARVYVIFPSRFFWKTKAINYIWANKLPKESAIPNPFAENAVMIAVQSGTAETGIWKEEKRSILEDYRKYFGGDVPEAGGVAIMTDTDNTGESATAWYGPITLQPSGR